MNSIPHLKKAFWSSPFLGTNEFFSSFLLQEAVGHGVQAEQSFQHGLVGCSPLTCSVQNPTPCLSISSKILAIAELLWQLLGYELESHPTDGSRNKPAF